jgi:hypothetical protein
VRVTVRRLSGASSLAEATVCRSAPPDAATSLVTATCTGWPW